MENSKYLTKRQASEYLTDSLGLPVAEKTLSKLIVHGGGPKYQKFGVRVVYSQTELTDWAKSKLSKTFENSSQEVR